jgi:predicted nucleic acid-binding protein
VDRVFLDANVLFSAAWRSDAGLLHLWRLKRVVLVTSDYAVQEALRNLRQEEQRTRLGTLLEHVEIVSGTFYGVPLPRRVRLPEDDLPILRAAIASGCTHLLTGNLRDFGPYLGMRLGGALVVLPATYLGHAAASPRPR